MAKKKTKALTPLMLLWSKRDQLRFVDAVERLNGLVNDLQTILAEPKRRAEAAAATRAARAAEGPTVQHVRSVVGTIPPMSDSDIREAIAAWVSEHAPADVDGDGCDLRISGPGLNDREGLDPSTLIV